MDDFNEDEVEDEFFFEDDEDKDADDSNDDYAFTDGEEDE